MKILIVGGTGLISTAITDELVERGDEVTVYNRGSTGPPRGVEQLVGDRGDFATFERQIADAGSFDCVIDMVCYKPEEARSAVRAFSGRTDHYIFCSTVDVYAKPALSYPIREDERPYTSDAFPYARDKAACERIVFEAHEQGSLAVTSIPPAHTYGEGRGLIYSLGGGTGYLDRVRKGKPIVVHGDGTSLWAACHRDDVAHAFAAAAGSSRTFGKGYHVTGEEWMTWDRYHAAVAEAMGAPRPELVHIPTDLLHRATERGWISAVNFQYNNIFDNSAAHADLDFKYTVDFISGVRRIVAWLDAHQGFDNSDDDPFEDRLIAAWHTHADAFVRELAPEDTTAGTT